MARSEWEQFRADEPAQSEPLTVLAESHDISGPGVIASSRTPPEVVEAVRRALVDDVRPGANATALTDVHEFVRAGEASYDDVWELVYDYNRKLRPVLPMRGRDLR